MCLRGMRAVPGGLLIVVAGLWVASATAQTSNSAATVFAARGIPVDATAETAAAARDIAIKQGQEQAIASMLRRITFRGDHSRLPTVPPKEINNIVEGIEFKDEKTSPTRYLAKLTVSFKSERIRQLLRAEGIPFTETRAKPVLVLAVFERAGALLLFDDGNPWRTAWERHQFIEDALFPIVLPEGDLRDVAAVGPERAIAGDATTLRRIGDRYGVESVFIAHASLRINFATGGVPELTVTLHRFGSVGEGAEIQTFTGAAGQPPSEFFDDVVTLIARRLEEDWKRQTAPQFDTELKLSARVPLAELKDWVAVRTRLARNAMIKKVELTSLSREDAQVVLHYLGQPAQLMITLAQDDLELIDEEGFWLLQRRTAKQ